MAYSRGSEWHRWDLHLHTPETKKNDQYEGETTEVKWDNFYKHINQYLRKDGATSDVTAVGITDYSSIDNYQKVINDKRLPSSLFVLPNVEMRISTKSGSSPVNIHFLFDPEYADKVNELFFAELKFTYGKETYNASMNSLSDLGEAIQKSQGHQVERVSAYHLGLESFLPSLDAFASVFEKHPKLRAHTLIGVPNSSNDGASGLGNGQMGPYRDSLYQFCDFIFSGKLKDREYFLGQGCDSETIIMSRYGSIMPCLHGCDAHELNKIFEPDEERYCWIKADPTFNGLKQVLYEPESRVSISPSKPEVKRDYQVIESIQFHGDDFDSTVIPLNQNLNCIIGGRSTGKTLFLHNLAKAVDSEQSEKREHSAATPSMTVETSVVWSDRSHSNTNSENTSHKVIYIPQSYLNRLSEDTSSSDINDMIEPILLADNSIASAKETTEKQIAELSQSIRTEAFQFGELAKQVRELSSEMSEIGTRKGIKSEIDKINQQRAAIAAQNQISENDVIRYNGAQKQLHEAEVIISTIASNVAIVESKDTLIAKVEPWPTTELESVQSEFDKAWNEISQSSKEIWHMHQQLILDDLHARQLETINKQDEAKHVIESLKPSIDITAELKILSERLAEETKRLDEFDKKEKKATEARAELDESLQTLFSLHESFADIKKSFTNQIASNNTESSDNDGGVLLSADVVYQYDELASCVTNYVDGRKLRSRKELRSFIEDQTYDQESKYPKQQIQKLILDSIRDDTLIKGNLDQFVSVLFADHTVIKYGAELDGDKLARMSPGKKALLYLKLLIELDTSQSPILIDQPEDDLDNRSIYNELIPFLKQKKSGRQMIIVTHNANVVLGADAEEIIVANQNGDDSYNQNARFEYISGSIEDDLPQDLGAQGILQNKSIQQHICEVLEGGRKAFELRRRKYTTLVD